jgi:hypothetical protein
VPYERIARNFGIASSQGAIEIIKNFLSKHIHLNTLTMIAIGSMLVVAIGFLFTPGEPVETTQENEMYISHAIPVDPSEPTLIKKEEHKPDQALLPVPITKMKPAGPSESLEVPASELTVVVPQMIKEQDGPVGRAYIPSIQLTRENTPILRSNKEAGMTEEYQDLMANTVEPAVGVPSREEILFTIYSTDGPEKKTQIIEGMKKYGIRAKLNLQYNSQKSIIEKLTLDLSYRKRLDWRMKLSGFDVMEIKLLLDAKGMPASLSYRLNDQKEFSEPIGIGPGSDSKISIRSEESISDSDHN